jgi:site-specific recombinase
MASSEEIFSNWNGIISNDFAETISQTFKLPKNDTYIYRADSFAMTLPQIASQADKLKYKYQSHGQAIEVCLCPETRY